MRDELELLSDIAIGRRPPCAHCGGWIGPDRTGRPACYGCAPTSTLLDVTCPKCGEDRRLRSDGPSPHVPNLLLVCPCGASTRRSEVRPSIGEMERLLDATISRMAKRPAMFVRFPRWRWWLVLWPPALKSYIDDTAKFYAAHVSIDQGGR